MFDRLLEKIKLVEHPLVSKYNIFDAHCNAKVPDGVMFNYHISPGVKQTRIGAWTGASR